MSESSIRYPVLAAAGDAAFAGGRELRSTVEERIESCGVGAKSGVRNVRNPKPGHSERSNPYLRWLLALAISFTANTTAAQDLEELEARLKTLQDEEATQARLGTMLVRTDRDCALRVNGKAKGQLRADESKTLRVNPGQQLVECVGQGGVRAEWSDRVPSGEQVVVGLTVLPPERFVRMNDGVQDQEQRVLWAAFDNGSDVNWLQAQQHCRSLGSGWVLPTSAQLESLYDDLGTYENAVAAAPQAVKIKPASPLIDFTGAWYWSSESRGSSEALGVSLVYGVTLSPIVSFALNARALCARRF